MIAKRINIKEPIWSSKSVGLNIGALKSGLIEVTILHTDKSGHRTYPGTFLIDARKVRKFRTQTIIRYNTVLHIVPIAELLPSQ